MTRPTSIAALRRPDGTFPPLRGCDPNGEAQLKEKLKRVENDLAAARDEHRAAVVVRDQARQAYAAQPNLGTNTPAFRAAQDAVRAVGAVEDRIAALQAEQVGILQMLGRDAPSAPAAGGAPTWPGGNWDSSALLTDGMRQHLAAIAASSMPAGSRVPLGELISRDALAASFQAASITGTDNMRRGDFLGVVPQLRRSLSVLDLIPTGTMTGKSVPYTIEGGANTAAAETAEGALKPEAGLSLTDAEAEARTIAHWHATNRQSLADQPALRATLESRLRFGVLRRLQDAILAGSGTGANLRGILNTPGIGAIAYDADELIADQILRGLTTILLADGNANGIVLNPLDWQTTVIAKSAGDGQYYSGGPFSSQPQTMWGLPLIPSNALAQGTALVGDFEIGAQLFIREGVQVLLSDSDQDDFIRNQVKLLAEMRAALAVFRPAVFCAVDLAA